MCQNRPYLTASPGRRLQPLVSLPWVLQRPLLLKTLFIPNFVIQIAQNTKVAITRLNARVVGPTNLNFIQFCSILPAENFAFQSQVLQGQIGLKFAADKGVDGAHAEHAGEKSKSGTILDFRHRALWVFWIYDFGLLGSQWNGFNLRLITQANQEPNHFCASTYLLLVVKLWNNYRGRVFCPFVICDTQGHNIAAGLLIGVEDFNTCACISVAKIPLVSYNFAIWIERLAAIEA